MEWGLKQITKELVTKVFNGRPHRFLRRGIFDLHHSFNLLPQEKAFIYTGRGPSSKHLHLGHLVPFEMAGWLSATLGCRLVVQISDDEKYMTRQLSWEQVDEFARENISDIRRITQAEGARDVVIFRNTKDISLLYRTVIDIHRHIALTRYKAIFGQTETIANYFYAAIQIAPCFTPQAFSLPADALCIVPCSIDQFPYFRLARMVAEKLGRKPPILLICSRALPGLSGSEKMSSSFNNGLVGEHTEQSAIFLNDDTETVRRKLMKAISGGKATAREQSEMGADLGKDVAFRILHYLLEDDEQLDMIAAEYSRGRISSIEVKELAILTVNDRLSKLGGFTDIYSTKAQDKLVT